MHTTRSTRRPRSFRLATASARTGLHQCQMVSWLRSAFDLLWSRHTPDAAAAVRSARPGRDLGRSDVVSGGEPERAVGVH